MAVYLDIGRWLLKLLHTVAGVGVCVPQQGDVVCCGGLQAVAHPPDPGKHDTKAAGDEEGRENITKPRKLKPAHLKFFVSIAPQQHKQSQARNKPDVLIALRAPSHKFFFPLKL